MRMPAQYHAIYYPNSANGIQYGGKLQSKKDLIDRMVNRKAVQKTILIASIGILLLSACGPLSSAPTNLTNTATENTPENKPSQEASATATPTLMPTSEVVSVYVDPNLPAEFKDSLQLDAAGFVLAESENVTAKLTFGSEDPISTWIYALVAPFRTITDGINAAELQAFWQKARPTVF